MRRAIPCIFLILMATINCGSANDIAENIYDGNKDSIVYIEVAQDSEAPSKPPVIGTGFLISEDGLIITSKHITSGYINPDRTPIKVRIGSNVGGDIPAALSDFNIGMDMSLLKIPANTGFHREKYVVPERGDARDMKPGSDLYLLSFKERGPLSITKLQLISTTGGGVGDLFTWEVSSGATKGSSGGPIFDTDGQIIGILIGGIPGIPINYMYPEYLFELYASMAKWKRRTEIFKDNPERRFIKFNELEKIAGQWGRDGTGESVTILQNLKGWDLYDSSKGRFLVTRSEARNGSNIKVEGRFASGDQAITSCYFTAYDIQPNRMQWSPLSNGDKNCAAAKFTKAPSWEELKEIQAREIATKKTLEANSAAKLSNEKTPNANLEQVKAAAETAQRAAVAAKKVAEEKASSEVRRAAERRNEIEASRRNGPVALKDVEVVYFDRPSDEGLVSSALGELNATFDTRSSDQETESNLITCGPNVSVSAIRLVTQALLKKGVKIRAIEPSYWPQFKNRITIESVNRLKDYPPINIQRINRITSCAMPETFTYRIKNDCPGSLITVLLRYRKETDGSWAWASQRRIDYGSSKLLTNREGVAYSIQPDALFHARDENDMFGSYWPGTGEKIDLDIPDSFGAGRKRFGRIQTGTLSLTCRN